MQHIYRDWSDTPAASYEQTITYVDGNGNGTKPTAMTMYFNGSMYGYSYSMAYDGQNRLTQWSYSWDDESISVSFSYNPLRITMGDSEGGYVFSNLKQNSDGYVTSMDIRYTEDGETESGTCTMQYDNDGHITRYRMSSPGGTVNQSFTWNDGNLTSMTATDADGVHYATNYTYGSQPNTTGNCTYGIEMAYFTVNYFMPFTNLFGKNSKNLPTGFTSTEDFNGDEDNEAYHESEKYALSYELNEDGTIDKEHITNNGTSYYFQYSY